MPPPKILLVQLGRLGDFILATPMLAALKQYHPQPQIHVLASRHNQALVRAHPLVDKTLLHSKRLGQTLKLLIQLKRERYDYWIDPKDHFSRESSWLAAWSSASCKVGYNPEHRKPVFDVTIPSAQDNYHDQVALRNLRALQVLRVQNANPRPVLFTEASFEKRLDDFLVEHQIGKYYCIHLSASKEIRHWPQKNWIAFLGEIAADQRHFLLTCAPQDAALARAIAGQVAQAQYYPADSIIAAFSVIKRAELVISPDTSVVHIAAAFDRPLLGLYSNEEWNLKKFRPLSTHHRVVTANQPGAFVRDVPLPLMLEKYRELLQEIRPSHFT